MCCILFGLRIEIYLPWNPDYPGLDVRRQLIGTQGVADVASFGRLSQQYEIALNIDKLRSFNISIW